MVDAAFVKKTLRACFYFFLRWGVGFPCSLLLEHCFFPRFLHRLLIWLSCCWGFYLFPSHGHDWLEVVRCHFDWDCGRYSSPAAPEVAWGELFFTPISILAAWVAIDYYFSHIKREVRLRRQLKRDESYIPVFSRWKPKWYSVYFWWF